MRDYSKISPTVWQSPRFSNLESDEVKLLHLYLMTSSHQTSAGCYQLPDGYACSDLGWELQRYRQAREQLINAGLIDFDAEASVIIVNRWFKHNPPMSESHLLGIERVLEGIPSQSICEAAQEALRESWESVQAQKAIAAQRRQKPALGVSNGSGAGFPDKLNTSYLGGKR
jgi:hypothetical protein